MGTATAGNCRMVAFLLRVLMKKKKQTLLWAFEPGEKLLTKGAVEGTSYLFGTMHVRDQRAFGFLELVYKKIDLCEAFATEFNLEEMNQEASAGMMDLPEGQTLQDLYSPRKYKKLQKVFAKITGLQLDFFEHAQPMLITNLISEALLSKDMPFSLDESLWRYAKDAGKILLGLETYEQQLAIIQKIPLDYQVKSLSDLGKNFKRFRKNLLGMTDAYAEADLQKLYQQARKSASGLRKILLYNRNRVMADRILEINREHSLCCAIGAGHLGGKHGVLRHLKKAGYQLQPIGLPES